jgi:hypothetical protein
MAEPLTREGPLDVLENAIRVLREAGISTLFLHWIGSIPFALAVLMFLLQVSDSRATDPVVALESLGLAILFVWMNCWRSIFAGTVRARLSSEVAAARPRGGLLNLIAVQAVAGATKLLVLPFATLIVFPLPTVVAYYRSLAVIASGPVHGGPRESFSRARRLARYQPELSWLVFPLLFLLALVVWLNCLAIIASSPQLVRILTGYESTFSRSGIYFMMSSMCIGLSLALAWVVFDPFIQAVYCIRCYQAESLETGEDVRAGIRNLRLRAPAAAAMVALLFAACAPLVRANITPADLQKASAAAMQSPEYTWRLPPPEKDGPRSVPWIVSFFNRLADSTKSIRHAIGRVIDAFFRWLGDQFGGSDPKPGALPNRGLHWTVWLVIVVAGGIIAFVAFRILRSRYEANDAAPAEAIQSVRLDAEDLTADRMPEDQWIELADQSLREGDLRLALRAFYLANLSWMGRAEFISIHPGKTNREYELELRRRGRTFPEARALFGANVAVFERAWYGLRDVAMEEIDEFRDRAARMKSILTSGTGAAA